MRKRVWRSWVLPALWPVAASCLKIIALSSREVTPSTCNRNLALVLIGSEDSFISGRVAGQDLTNLSSMWLKETLGVKSLRSVKALEGMTKQVKPDVTLITYDWLLEHDHRPLRSAAKIAMLLRGIQSPAFVLLPDGFRLTVTAMGSLIVALAGGSQIVLQDSIGSHLSFGTVRPTGPHFWTWPPGHLAAWRSEKPWSDREKLALIAAGGGGPYREWVARQIEPRLTSLGYTTRRTSNDLSWPDYVNVHLKSRLVVTTCKMQPEYRVGPRYYKEKIPESTITGRVWEAFASGNVLITDANPVLDSLGFVAGYHYVPLPSWSEANWSEWTLPTEDELDTIAANGNLRFQTCVAREVT